MSFLGGVVKERKALLKNDLVKFGSIVVLAFVVFLVYQVQSCPIIQCRAILLQRWFWDHT